MTTEEWANRLRAFENNAPRLIDRALLVSLNQFEGQLKNRVFKKGEDENNSQIGDYSPPYAQYRRKRGRQAQYVDLQLEGNLIRSIQTKRIQGGYALVFANPKQAKIARDNEKRFKGAEGTIFDISAEERKKAIEAQNKQFERDIELILNA